MRAGERSSGMTSWWKLTLASAAPLTSSPTAADSVARASSSSSVQGIATAGSWVRMA